MDDFNSLYQLVDQLKASRKSIYLGLDHTGNPLFAKMDETLGILGGTRSGKTSSQIIPSVACHPGPVIVTTTREEIKDATWKSREAIAERYGGQVVEINFDPSSANGHDGEFSWDVLDGFNTYQECAQLAECFVRSAFTNPEHDHWADSVKRLMISYFYAARVYDQSFEDLADAVFAPLPGERNLLLDEGISSSSDRRLTVKHYAEVLKDVAGKAMAGKRANGKPTHFSNGLELASQPWDFMNSIFAQGRSGTEERSSIMSFASRLLEPWHGATHSSQPKFDVRNLSGSHSTVYITIPSANAERIAPMIVAFLATVEREWNKVNSGRGPYIDAPLLLALDETANVSPIPRLSSLLSEGGGNGIQTITVFQDPDQARDRWPGKGESILNLPNHKLLFAGVEDIEYLEKLSRLSGIRYVTGKETTIRDDYVHSPRMAGVSRLIRERVILDQATADPDTTGKNQHREQWELYSQMTGERFQDGLEIRKPFYLDDPNDHVSALVREVYGLTLNEATRDRRQQVEVDELEHIPTGTAYSRSRVDSSFVDVPRWFESDFWKDVMGYEALSHSIGRAY